MKMVIDEKAQAEFMAKDKRSRAANAIVMEIAEQLGRMLENRIQFQFISIEITHEEEQLLREFNHTRPSSIIAIQRKHVEGADEGAPFCLHYYVKG